MTVGSNFADHNQTAFAYFGHNTSTRVNTDSIIVEALRAEYPDLHLVVVPTYSASLESYAANGHAHLAPIDKERDRLSWRLFAPPTRRLDGQRGALAEDIKFGKFLLEWEGKEFVVVIADGRDGQGAYPDIRNQYILSGSIEQINRLVFAAGLFQSDLHEEIWVFDQGYWQKSKDLWQDVQKSHWEDVILDEDMKKGIIADVENFFDSRETYEKLRVPWKRGVIYYGKPGNGKTISIKAMMNALYKRKDPIPTLYVKSLSSFAGPEYSVNLIFAQARRYAPCYLIFEDLDSLITDNVRSYFLNAVDGISKNDGIMMVGSTNHLERLDPSIAKRPSRFDRKWHFPDPNEAERTKYMHYWQGKLSDNNDIDFPDKLCPAIAKITSGFSFAYMQEAMVASLMEIARDVDGFIARTCLECLEVHSESESEMGVACDKDAKRKFIKMYDWIWMVRNADSKDPDLDNYILWRVVKKQVRILREEMGDDNDPTVKTILVR
ncbi:Hypothetical protein R9X50_00043900 [Acrodontium crateriforme]|uniref:AAA+ ATPase domain-containing protein n=1 Tax=Acrodontium crateriforme TaxID=150365 RepID=A0AAQ3R735_9PEZI|nr:Hypothetical protein R9X50_00043900 [Acrodontium crateriforme]